MARIGARLLLGTYGTIYLRADGDWYYVLDDARTDINALTDGASSLVDEFEVRIQEMEDPTIVSNVLELTISIAGKNDAPSSITASSTTTTYSGTVPPPGHIIATLTSTDLILTLPVIPIPTRLIRVARMHPRLRLSVISCSLPPVVLLIEMPGTLGLLG